jgi:hypothetical protein
MAYAYLSTGREKVMSEEREKVLRMALKAVLLAARELHIDVDELTEAAIQSMLQDRSLEAEDIAQASSAIEVAADALDYDGAQGG